MLKEQYEVKVGPGCRIEESRGLDGNDGGDIGISVNGSEFEELFVVFNQWAIVQNIEEIIFVLRLLIDSIRCLYEVGNIGR